MSGPTGDPNYFFSPAELERCYQANVEAERERELDERESELDAREEGLNKREEDIASRERLCDMRDKEHMSEDYSELNIANTAAENALLELVEILDGYDENFYIGGAKACLQEVNNKVYEMLKELREANGEVCERLKELKQEVEK